MARHIEEPTVQEDGFQGGKRYRHPAYGQISVSRTSGGRTALYGSDFIHQQSVRVSISTSTMDRHLNSDWPHEDREIIEIEMSEAQWATFVSSFGIGGGVQCTIRHRDGKMVPGFPLRDEAREFGAEMSEQSKDALIALENAIAAVADSKMSKKDADKIIGSIRTAAREIGVNADFVQKCFDEHMETRTEKAKVEIHAYMQNAVQRAGLETLMKGAAPALLIGGEE